MGNEVVDRVRGRGPAEQEALGPVAAERLEGVELTSVSTPSAITISPRSWDELDGGGDDRPLVGAALPGRAMSVRSILTKSSGNRLR